MVLVAYANNLLYTGTTYRKPNLYQAKSVFYSRPGQIHKNYLFLDKKRFMNQNVVGFVIDIIAVLKVNAKSHVS